MKKTSKVMLVRQVYRVPLNVCKELSKKVLFPFVIKCLQNKFIYAPRINNLKVHKREIPLFGSVFLRFEQNVIASVIFVQLPCGMK